MWNENMCRDLVAQEIPSYWCTPIIQGYVDMQQPKPDVKLIFIARRHWKMGGTRYNARGLDEDANVANHTETEQLVIIHNKSNSEEE